MNPVMKHRTHRHGDTETRKHPHVPTCACSMRRAYLVESCGPLVQIRLFWQRQRPRDALAWVADAADLRVSESLSKPCTAHINDDDCQISMVDVIVW